MKKVAVVAHTGKTFGGGLGELREALAREGLLHPLWFEVAKSREAPKYARRAMKEGAEVLFVWGGDGTVQRCIDAIAGTEILLAILPAGTANLLATNLEVPNDVTEAVKVGLHGQRRPLDTGSVNGEHFAVMAGAGFDALMIKQADGGMKDRLGRVACIQSRSWDGPASFLASSRRHAVLGSSKSSPEGCLRVATEPWVRVVVPTTSRQMPSSGLLVWRLMVIRLR